MIIMMLAMFLYIDLSTVPVYLVYLVPGVLGTGHSYNIFGIFCYRFVLVVYYSATCVGTLVLLCCWQNRITKNTSHRRDIALVNIETAIPPSNHIIYAIHNGLVFLPSRCLDSN